MKKPMLDFDDLKYLNGLLKIYPASAEKAASKQLAKCALDLQGKAQLQAPKDLGDLRGSAYANVEGKDLIPDSPDTDPTTPRAEKTKGGKLEAVIGFTEPYALIQHEELGFRHTDGNAKYMEKPYMENKDKYISSIGKAVQNALEKAEVNDGSS